MTESQRAQMLADCKRMLRSFTDEEMENKRIAERKLRRLLEFCDRHNLELKDSKILMKGDGNYDTSN